MRLDRNALVPGLVALFAALGAAWFFASYEKAPVEVVVGYQGEARRNRLFAAERLLASFGLKAKSLAQLRELPPSGATLILPTRRDQLGEFRARELMNWVRAGGHLIVVAYPPAIGLAFRPDPLLAPLAIRGQTSAQAPRPGAAPTVIDLPGSKDFLEVMFNPRFRLDYRGRDVVTTAGGAHGYHMVQVAAGKGRLTVLSDYRFLQNPAIGEYDHGAFLLYLTGTKRGDVVWLVYGEDMPNLLEWLWENAWTVLAAGAVLLALWVWRAGSRFGPLLPVPPAARRRLLEHIEASGRFLWRHGHRRELLAGVRESLMRSLEFRHPGWSSAPDLNRRLAQASGLSEDEVAAALAFSNVSDPQQFTRTLKTLETIRKNL
ncbi:MAG: hypothetical protein HYU77_14440 [Betaproteobacteria bacterium]|nr:hypothetical protein [Betaproteobacteria bacterium]